MFNHATKSFLMLLAVGVLAACSRTPYAPSAGDTQEVDVSSFAPKVDSFVVLLDTSGSMKDEAGARTEIQEAQDLVASFNAAVPPIDFNAGLVVFGKGAGSCIGDGLAKTIYGMTTYNSADFASALGSIECAASTTPIADAVDMTTGHLAEDTGSIAVVIFSDFEWNDPGAVSDAVSALKAQHGNNVCVHTVKIGDYAGSDALIGEITGNAGCDSAVNAADIASAAAMQTYVEETLMAPLQYEKHTVSAMALFGLDSAVLTEQGKAELHNLAAMIRDKGLSVGDIDIIGHTCSLGSESYNQRLSERRAQSVADYLVSQGVNGDIIDVSGMGEIDPVADNATEEGRIQNRRVEVHVGTSRPTQ